jgi:predicted N-acetyltransferase YhbS
VERNGVRIKINIGGYMKVQLRRGTAADAAAAGDICYRSFKAIAEAHNFIPDVPSSEAGAGLVSHLICHDGIFDVIAESEGRIVGSNFLDERNGISGVGPITVDPTLQNDGIGRALMQAVMQRSEERGFAGIRLVQSGYHNRSLALYLRLGFWAREQLVCLQGSALGSAVAGFNVRAAVAGDLEACNRLCQRVHGHHRSGELHDAIAHGSAMLVEHDSRVTGYATSISFFGHAVGESDDDLKALIGASASFAGPGFLLPTRNSELLRWCLAQRLRITYTLTLMTIGLYNRPDGKWLPSIIY